MTCMNDLFYTDDAVLLGPTVDGPQRLIDQDFCQEVGYGVLLSECSAFIPNTLGSIHTPDVYLGTKKWIKWMRG